MQPKEKVVYKIISWQVCFFSYFVQECTEHEYSLLFLFAALKLESLLELAGLIEDEGCEENET